MNMKILKRFLVLTMLLCCLGWVSLADSGNQVVNAAAAPCCSECPGGGDPVEVVPICEAQCGGTGNSCYTQCINQAYSCYTYCIYGC